MLPFQSLADEGKPALLVKGDHHGGDSVTSGFVLTVLADVVDPVLEGAGTSRKLLGVGPPVRLALVEAMGRPNPRMT